MNERNNPNQVDRRLLTVSDRDIFVTVQRALLVGIILKNETRADKEESLKELTNLVKLLVRLHILSKLNVLIKSIQKHLLAKVR